MKQMLESHNNHLMVSRKVYARSNFTNFRNQWIYSAWSLLSLANWFGRIARHRRWTDCHSIFFHSDYAVLLYKPATPRSCISKSCVLIWRVYHCLRHHSRDGNLDTVVSSLLGFRNTQSYNRHHFAIHSLWVVFHNSHSPIYAKCWWVNQSKSGVRKWDFRARGYGVSATGKWKALSKPSYGTRTEG